MNPGQALARITALCGEERWPNSPLAADVRAILAEVSPEAGGYAVELGGQRFTEAQWNAVLLYCRGTARGGVLDRDQARDVLRPFLESFPEGMRQQVERELLDALAGCVRPAAIDRDALVQVLGSFAGEAFGSGNLDYTAWADGILALVRPVAGVVLSPEEAALARSWYRGDRATENPDERALAARLEAAS